MEWRVSGRYFEACSCEVVCPCRRVNGRPGGRSTYGVCHFALGWSIDSGTADDLDLSGFEVVMAGSYDDDEPGSPWRVVLYVDARATAEQQRAMDPFPELTPREREVLAQAGEPGDRPAACQSATARRAITSAKSSQSCR
jgi:hypothetical protein